MTDVNLKKGYLLKKGPKLSGKRKRWFVLSDEEFTYWENEKEQVKKGTIPIVNIYSIEINGKKDFQIKTLQKCYDLSADTISECVEWVEAIEKKMTKMKAASGNKTNIRPMLLQEETASPSSSPSSPSYMHFAASVASSSPPKSPAAPAAAATSPLAIPESRTSAVSASPEKPPAKAAAVITASGTPEAAAATATATADKEIDMEKLKRVNAILKAKLAESRANLVKAQLKVQHEQQQPQQQAQSPPPQGPSPSSEPSQDSITIRKLQEELLHKDETIASLEKKMIELRATLEEKEFKLEETTKMMRSMLAKFKSISKMQSRSIEEFEVEMSIANL